MIVTRVGHEGLVDYASLLDYDDKSIKFIAAACRETILGIPTVGVIPAIPTIPGVSLPMRSLIRLTHAIHASKYHRSIGRTLNV